MSEVTDVELNMLGSKVPLITLELEESSTLQVDDGNAPALKDTLKWWQ
jgi:hypothetical protein